MSSRLLPESADTQDFMQNKNTKHTTDCHIRLFKNWLSSRDENRVPEDIPPRQLDMYLAQFILTVRKNGDEDGDHPSRQYEPSTLISIHCSIFRYLNSKNYVHNLKTSHVFKHSRDVLSAKLKELKQLGKGNKPRAAQAFTTDELTRLAELNLLGIANAEAILNTMWLNNTVHFGLRGRQHHEKMLWGDIELKTDDSGSQFLEFNQRATKTRQGATQDVDSFLPKMYSTGCNQCPVKVYLEYAKRRPPEMCQPGCRFYLQPLKNPSSDIWYSKQPLGKNTIGNLAKIMATKAGLASSGNRITNHSARKLTIQTLVHAGIPPTNIVQLTGHRKLQSLNSSSQLSLEQQRAMSNLLSEQMPSIIPPNTTEQMTSIILPNMIVVQPTESVLPTSSTVMVPTPDDLPNFDLDFSLRDRVLQVEGVVIGSVGISDGACETVGVSNEDACGAVCVSSALHPPTVLSGQMDGVTATHPGISDARCDIMVTERQSAAAHWDVKNIDWKPPLHLGHQKFDSFDVFVDHRPTEQHVDLVTVVQDEIQCLRNLPVEVSVKTEIDEHDATHMLPTSYTSDQILMDEAQVNSCESEHCTKNDMDFVQPLSEFTSSQPKDSPNRQKCTCRSPAGCRERLVTDPTDTTCVVADDADCMQVDSVHSERWTQTDLTGADIDELMRGRCSVTQVYVAPGGTYVKNVRQIGYS